MERGKVPVCARVKSPVLKSAGSCRICQLRDKPPCGDLSALPGETLVPSSDRDVNMDLFLFRQQTTQDILALQQSDISLAQPTHFITITLHPRGSQDVLADWEGVGPLAANAFLAADSATRDDASAEKIRLTELSNRRSKGAESHALNALKVTVGKVLAPEDNLSRARARARGMNCS
ncbi:hypothetical protein Bbelb_439370 [Branchiostoma belcheri]|nr:hypothetical protein Bbelb_439370 [Branchiostoma belcheri]